jgi:hypothetical protein
MDEKFQKIGPNNIKSETGFTVTWRSPGSVDYTDGSNKLRVDAEVLVEPARILLYKESVDLQAMTSSHANEIITNIAQALEFLGYRVER